MELSPELTISLLGILGSLAGTLVGGYIAFAASRSAQRQRWKYDRLEKRAELERVALSAALDWISPMRDGYIKAASLVSAAIRGDIEEERFSKDYPNLLLEFTEMDLPGDQRAVLPEGVYARGIKVIQNIDELRYLGLRFGQEARIRKGTFPGLKESSEKMGEIDSMITDLETDLRVAFRMTFE